MNRIIQSSETEIRNFKYLKRALNITTRQKYLNRPLKQTTKTTVNYICSKLSTTWTIIETDSQLITEPLFREIYIGY